MGMRNHEWVPTLLIEKIAALKKSNCHKVIKNLLKFKLIKHQSKRYDGKGKGSGLIERVSVEVFGVWLFGVECVCEEGGFEVDWDADWDREGVGYLFVQE